MKHNDQFQDKMEAHLASAPAVFVDAFALIVMENPEAAQTKFDQAAAVLKEKDPDWAGAARCCQAYCLKELERHRESVQCAATGRSLGLNFVGKWYYFDAIVTSLNMIDELAAALEEARAAIQYFLDQDAPSFVGDHCFRKSNILKQMAATESRSLSTVSLAKAHIIEAIDAISASIAIQPDGWEDLDEELAGIARIAARAGVTPPDLESLETLKGLQPLLDRYFGNSLVCSVVTEQFNMANEARREGDRRLAAEYFRIAVSVGPEKDPNDRAFKAFVAYQAGVNLERLEGLDSVPAGRIGAAKLDAVAEIQRYFRITLHLYSTLPADAIRSFDNSFPPGLSDAIVRIKRDDLMSMRVSWDWC